MAICITPTHPAEMSTLQLLTSDMLEASDPVPFDFQMPPQVHSVHRLVSRSFEEHWNRYHADYLDVRSLKDDQLPSCGNFTFLVKVGVIRLPSLSAVL